MTDRAPAASAAASKAWLRALEMTAAIPRRADRIFPILMQELAARFESTPALTCERDHLTYRGLAQRANQYSRWALDQGLVSGAVAGLLMPNCAEYVAIWLGVTRVGGVVALINTALAGDALAHSINVVKASHLIVAAEYADRCTAIFQSLPQRPRCWLHGGNAPQFACIDDSLQDMSLDALSAGACRAPTLNDQALCIYTSGTSGLPKAVRVSHFRVMQWTHWFAGLMDIRQQDRMYDCLPMYHSVGGIIAIGAPLVAGAQVVIRRRFSVSEFWNDIVTFDCTLFQYIGELCRYLTNSPAQAHENEHHLRLCCGNGLRSEVWLRFKERFRIPQILEYYASTEGAISLYNCEERVGSIGRLPPTMRKAVRLIRFDEESGEPLRDENGLCQACREGEVGEAVAQVSVGSRSVANQFEGYTDDAATTRKMLHDVVVAGDSWYRSGDAMQRDASGFFYFVDRMGDTYRWKGENVAASEVASCLRAFAGIIDVAVYGVRVPGTEGRAGMAAIVAEGPIDLTGLRHYVQEQLPSYARPLFLRVLRELPLTATHKPRIGELSWEAFDPSKSKDVIYFDDSEAQRYVAVDQELFGRLQTARLRL